MSTIYNISHTMTVRLLEGVRLIQFCCEVIPTAEQYSHL